MSESPAAAWGRCRPYVEAALEHAGGGHGIEDVQAGIVAGDYQFWPGRKCAVVTEILSSPRLKILNFWLLGGDLRELLVMRPQIEAWALSQGCGRAMGGGVSRAWTRVLAKAGYAPRWIVFTKELIA